MGKLWRWLMALFQRDGEQAPALPAPEPPPRKKRRSIAPFRAQILNNLDDYFSCMRRFREFAPDDYDLFSRVGAAVANTDGDTPILDIYQIEDFVPMSHGAIFTPLSPLDDDADAWAPAFVAFRKMGVVSRVTTIPGEHTYSVVTVYDTHQRWGKLSGCAFRYHVSVSDDGAITLLKEGQYERQALPLVRYGAARRKITGGYFYKLRWDFPGYLKLHTLCKTGKATVSQFAASLFLWAYNDARRVAEGFTITAAKNGEHAAFAVDLADAKTVFSDRSVMARSPSGAKKRIFHSVREHARETDKGVKLVRAHYRGLRVFDWNNYRIRILWPGQAKSVLVSDGPAAIDSAALPNLTAEKLKDSADYGRLVARLMRQAPRGREQ